MSKKHFQITNIQALPAYHLHLRYADGQAFEVDLQPWINTTKALRPLKDPSLFASATLGLGGRYVEWIENELSLDEEAKALGISRRMLIYYRDGEKPIPRSIWLACLGWEAIRPEGIALPRHIPSILEYTKLHQ